MHPLPSNPLAMLGFVRNARLESPTGLTIARVVDDAFLKWIITVLGWLLASDTRITKHSFYSVFIRRSSVGYVLGFQRLGFGVNFLTALKRSKAFWP